MATYSTMEQNFNFPLMTQKTIQDLKVPGAKDLRSNYQGFMQLSIQNQNYKNNL